MITAFVKITRRAIANDPFSSLTSFDAHTDPAMDTNLIPPNRVNACDQEKFYESLTEEFSARVNTSIQYIEHIYPAHCAECSNRRM